MILVGYSQKRKSFIVSDPSKRLSIINSLFDELEQYVTEMTLDKARLAEGTDQDMIFVNVE